MHPQHRETARCRRILGQPRTAANVWIADDRSVASPRRPWPRPVWDRAAGSPHRAQWRAPSQPHPSPVSDSNDSLRSCRGRRAGRGKCRFDCWDRHRKRHDWILTIDAAPVQFIHAGSEHDQERRSGSRTCARRLPVGVRLYHFAAGAYATRGAAARDVGALAVAPELTDGGHRGQHSSRICRSRKAAPGDSLQLRLEDQTMPSQHEEFDLDVRLQGMPAAKSLQAETEDQECNTRVSTCDATCDDANECAPDFSLAVTCNTCSPTCGGEGGTFCEETCGDVQTCPAHTCGVDCITDTCPEARCGLQYKRNLQSPGMP